MGKSKVQCPCLVRLWAFDEAMNALDETLKVIKNIKIYL